MPLIRELGLYCYDPTKLSEEPLDIDNHACDALRYLIVGHDRGRGLPMAYPVETVEQFDARLEAEHAERQRASWETKRRTEDDIREMSWNDLDWF